VQLLEHVERARELVLGGEAQLELEVIGELEYRGRRGGLKTRSL